jgi:hypothetical protein
MREFVDSRGVTWTVYEVERQGRAMAQRDPLPEAFRAGWIVFEAEGGQRKRRLAPVPADWRQRTDVELEALCRTATRVHGSEDSGAHAIGQRLERLFENRRP